MAQDPNDPNTPPTALADPNAPPPPKVVTKALAKKGLTLNYFCLESSHLAGSLRADIHDMARHFTATGGPNCPVCNRIVSALVVDDNTVLPPSIQTLKDRLEAAERAR